MLIDGADAGLWSATHSAGAIVSIPYASLTPSALKQHLPDCVVLPLFGSGFDALDALARLAQFGFAGPVAVTGPSLPNPAVIAGELSAAAPGMTIELVQSCGQT